MTGRRPWTSSRRSRRCASGRRDPLRRAGQRRPVSSGLSESERRTVESLTTQIVNKLLHLPIVRMKEAAATAEAPVTPTSSRHLFGLGEDESCSESEAAAVGSRSTQAELAADRLRGPGIEIALVPITTAGDRDRTKPFGQIGERGVFVKELEEALLDGRIDVAVHSAKDMTSTDTEGLVVGAYLRAGGSARRAVRRDRDRARDADRDGVGAPAGAAARARAVALRSSRSAETSTRGCASAASAGSTRSCSRRAGSIGSGSRSEIGHRFDPEEMLPEAGQGALALQVRAGEEELVAAVDDRGDAPARRGRARLRRRDRRRLPRTDRGAPRRHDADRADRRPRTGAGSSGEAATTRSRSRRELAALAA